LIKFLLTLIDVYKDLLKNSEYKIMNHDCTITNAKLVFAQHGRADFFFIHT